MPQPLIGLESLSDEAFERLSSINRHTLRIERDADGTLRIGEPSGSYAGRQNAAITGQLYLWNRQHRLGEVFDSSAGFTLPDRSKRAADAAFVPQAEWDALSAEAQRRFAPLCPVFVIELRSPSDSVGELQQKMERVWMPNGCRLGWLIDPEAERVYVYRADGSRDVVEGFDGEVSGENVLPGFALELAELR